MNLWWHCRLHVTSSETRLRLSDSKGDLLRARLNNPHHPRALVTLLEGLSLWAGRALCVALSVDESCPSSLGWPLSADAPWCNESQLVHFALVHPVRPRMQHAGHRERRQLRLAFRRRTP
jgi:hypothetical protein